MTSPGRLTAAPLPLRSAGICAAKWDLYVAAADGRSQRLLTRFAAFPAWSPDGSLIAFMRGNESLHVVAPDGSELRQLLPRKAGLEGCCPVWSPDGRWIAVPSFFNRGGIYIVAADGRGVRRFAGFDAGTALSWSPGATGLRSAVPLRTVWTHTSLH